MATVQLLNSPSQCVDDALEGLLATQPGLAWLRGHRVIVRRDLARWRAGCAHPHRFSVVSGGGSGHEPAHAGLVGPGLLTAAVCGDVFASPPVSAILATLRAVAAPAGVLLIVMNYTGDRLNFGLAAERARAEGVPVEMVVVGEDSALTGRDRSAGRRGLAGTIFIEKLAGACAEEGRRPLAEVAALLRAVVHQVATISVSLSACVKPGVGPSFDLPSGSMEIGVGIHGEAGVGRVPAVTADRAVAMMLDHLTSAESPVSLRLSGKVALLVNSLGGLSDVELRVVTTAAVTELRRRGVEVVRCRAGRLITSLAMSGVSLTVLNVCDPELGDSVPPVTAEQLLEWLDASASAPGWRYSAAPRDFHHLPRVVFPRAPQSTEGDGGSAQDDCVARRLSRCVEFAARALLACSGQMERLESGGGDSSDSSALYGGQMAALCRSVLDALPDLPLSRPSDLLSSLSELCERSAGLPGEEYSLALAAAAAAISETPDDWVGALRRGTEALRNWSPVPPGQRWTLDALQPALDAAERTGTAEAAAEAAQLAAEQTAARTASGRPAPAAHAVGVWVRAVAEALKLH
ncbi:PTS-dependent dihydroxyacetone kinase 1, dihydroxyacetone-binding subunit DhaK-like [Amphibalanus amphitrite]|uniref:PTS-dependent dihydroxyacetone kinase 1, dihydroxyacetone-binding subunit DhaK-like n=1 Tax=Amphibalanus amphitrite TaxID=1232801 RepID=UPI001C919860|nr:PTS-dependent dihydroxyacetone kinase 1, dihydroxyacetone-binding subunit DhaK-like [Amphibalanus amphitrite]